MAPLRARRRKRLPRSAFAYPATRRYPIDTLARARNALARAAQPQTRGSYQHVARAVRKRYGDRVASVGPRKGVLSRPGTRKRRSSGRRRAGGRKRTRRR
ncbi:MAG TPA: hypothetical protein VKB54_06920 [Solirubrobacteraceae bacterium]|nr:hypothetical protein [Solirubrobacteraceae bacterium]